MSKVVRFVAGAALVIVGGITLNPALAKAGFLLAATAGVDAVAQALQKRPQIDAAGITGRLQLSDQVDQWLAIGETALPSYLIYWGTAGADNKELSIIIAHACHPINSFVSLKINDIDTAFPTPGGAYAGILSIQTTLGTQTANPFTGVQGPWTEAGQGLAMSHFRWTYDEEKLRSGLPQNIQFVGRGIRVYDPRRDSTRGGSGTMRADDESTWAYEVGGTVLGNNPALVDLSYLLGWRKAGKLWAGMGQDPANINYADYIAGANLCDEIVGGARRYTINGLLSLADAHNVNRSRILACCAGKPTDQGGLLGLWVAHDDTAVATMSFNERDIVGDIKWEPLPEGLNRNTARGSFLDPGNSWSAQPYEEVRPADLLTLDNDVELVDRLDFGLVTNGSQARRLASIRVRESRQGVLTMPMRLKALGADPAKVIAITLPQQGWTNKRFRVETKAIDGETVTLRCRAVAAGDYASAGASTLVPPAAPNTVGYVTQVEDGADRTRGTVPVLPKGQLEDGANVIEGDIWLFGNASYVALQDHVSGAGNRPPAADFWGVWSVAADGTASRGFSQLFTVLGLQVLAEFSVRAGAGGNVELSATAGFNVASTSPSSNQLQLVWQRFTGSVWTDVGASATSASVAPGADGTLTISRTFASTAGTLTSFRLRGARVGPAYDPDTAPHEIQANGTASGAGV